jgi:cytosine/adenosine deaminase-related metal-dependent hydrolase
MPAPPSTPTTFLEILEQVWWRLDLVLDEEMIRWSAKLGALEALERGTTAIIDHHSSPNAIEGSLSVIADACAEVGVRVACAYEVTDRNGPEGALRGLEENRRFLGEGGRGWVGAHACFTLSDESLDGVTGLAEDLGVGVHIHVHEGPEDVGAGDRLEGRAQDSWLLAHAVHLERELSGTILHNPESNMNNSVGYANPTRFGNPVALGTDGIGGDMLGAFRASYLKHREAEVTATPDTAWSWLETGWDLFPEASRDSVTWSYDPMEPWHLAFTPGVRPVEVIIDGEAVLKDGVATRVDATEVRARAAEQARRLHDRL